MNQRAPSPPASVRGLSLIELLVGMVIALITSVAIFQVFAVSESHKRTTTGGSDALQSGGFASFTLSKMLSIAGAGLGGIDDTLLWGCNLQIYQREHEGDSDELTIGTSTSPYRKDPYNDEGACPFSKTLNFPIRLAPVMIKEGSTGDNPLATTCTPTSAALLETTDAADAIPDTLLIFAGSHPGTWAMSLESAGDGNVTVDTVLGINSTQNSDKPRNDLLMAVSHGETTCRIVELQDPPVDPDATTKVLLGQSKLPTRTDVSDLLKKDASMRIIDLGPSRQPWEGVNKFSDLLGREPLFAAVTVGSDTLTAHNLLMLDLIKNRVRTLADNIVMIKALYGVSEEVEDRQINTWVKPNGTWAYDAMTNDTIRRLRAVRVGIVTRNSTPEKEDVSAGKKMVLFADTDAAIEYTVPTDAADLSSPDNYRYQTFEFTVPLRSMVYRSDETKANKY